MNFIEEKNAKTKTYSLKNSNCKITQEVYNFLEEELKEHSIVRVCLHSSSDELTQVMIIAITKKASIKFHKNLHKNKIYHIIKGKMRIELKDELFELKENEIYKLEKNTFAKMYSSSDYCIYHETIAGPFQASDTVYEDK